MKYHTDLYPFESRWITLDGIKTHYIDEGQGDVLLFSHPPVASSFMYREFVMILRRKYRCIAIDYPGFGLSDMDNGYEASIAAQSRILEKFIHALGMQHIFVMGHDTGGPSAFKVAAEHPDLFEGLILTDTIIFPVTEYEKIDKMLGFVAGPFFEWLNAKTNLMVKLTYRQGIGTRKLAGYERLQYQEMFNTQAKRKRITKILHSLKRDESFMQQVKTGFETTLNEKPTLLIYGEKDPLTALGIPDRIKRLMPNSELYLIKNERHFPHEGQPEQMSEIIHHWLAQHRHFVFL